MFKVGKHFTLRHEKWGIEFLKYIIKNFFDGSIDSFYQQHHIRDILDCISKNFDAHDIIIFFTRCNLLLKSEGFILGKTIIQNFNLYDNISNSEKSDIYCYGYGNFYLEIEDYQSAISSLGQNKSSVIKSGSGLRCDINSKNGLIIFYNTKIYKHFGFGNILTNYFDNFNNFFIIDKIYNSIVLNTVYNRV